MSVTHIKAQKLITFHEEKVTRQTALKYVEEMEKAMTPFITVERRDDNKFNVIGGFKYITGIRLLKKDTKLYCTIVEPFQSDQKRILATLQRCLVNNENVKYKEILIQELTQVYKMTEDTISHELGHDSSKVKKYMYKQIIPKTYIDRADSLGIKPIIQAIYLANSFSSHEKRVLTELSLERLFLRKHMTLYKQYRKRYGLFDDFTMAKQQVFRVIATEHATNEYWADIPNPINYYFDDLDFNENSTTH